jgi:ribulose kinase
MWLTEGGQSATGSLIDHVIYSHKFSGELKEKSIFSGESGIFKLKFPVDFFLVYELLNEEIDRLSQELEFPALLTREFHVLPYFYGNRSPRADPTLLGAISGLKLDNSISHLAILYYATIQAIAYGTKHIIEEMNKKVTRYAYLY